jgi:saccharopine dehydrogenase (NAD+, L-lysine-forming)
MCTQLKFSIIGAGGVGQIILRQLTNAGSRVRVGDLDRSRLREAKLSQDVSTSRLDAGDPSKVRRFIKGSDVVINASNPRFNLVVMNQALKERVNYVDLAGDPETQLKLNPRWEKANLTAVLGMGEDPGLSNVMARHSVDMLDQVDQIKIRDGETSTSDRYPFVALFAPEVFLEEAVSPAYYFEDEKMKEVPAMSEKELFPFPHPIGKVPVYLMDHEETYTLPKFLPKKPNRVDFKLALTDDTASAIKLFRNVGLLNKHAIKVGRTKVSPLHLLVNLLPTPSEVAGKIRGSAGLVVETTGKQAGQPRCVRAYVTMTHEQAYGKYRANATSYLTGTPAAVCALMLATGRIKNRGAIVPELLDAGQFLDETRKFDINVQVENTPL